jgi:hypothetical protein
VKAPFFIAALAASSLLALGCGKAPSNLDACRHFCDKQGSCTNAGSAAVAECKNQCVVNRAQFDDNDAFIERTCKNPDDVKRAIYDCYDDFCDTDAAVQCADTEATNRCEFK